MALSNNKLILIFGFNEEEKTKIAEIILKNNLPKHKVISNFMAKMKVKNIIEGIKLPTVTKELAPEKVVLFNNLEDVELEKSLKLFKNEFKGIIFAVTTPTSINWTFEQLLSHLIEERKFVNNRGKK